MTGYTAEGGSDRSGPDASAPHSVRAGRPVPDQGAVPTEGVETGSGTARGSWPLYEVFVRGKRGLNHVHVGSLHAPDAEMALHNARDLYTRRNEGVSIWVVRAQDITASSPGEKDPFFAPAADKVYRHPTFYVIPEEVPHL